MRRHILVACLPLLLSACLSMGPRGDSPGASGAVPPWVLNPPADTAEIWYGVGEGADRDAARRAALKDVASRLRVSISGKLENQVTETNGQVDRQARIRVSEEVQKTEFRNFTVDQAAQGPKGFHVLVRVDRRAFVTDVRARLDALDATVAQAAPGLESSSPVERFVTLQRLRPTVDKAMAQAQLLLGAENGGSAGARMGRYQGLLRQADEAAGALVFHVRAQAADADIAQAVTTFVNENRMRADPAGGAGSTPLEVAATAMQDEIRGSRVVKLTVRLTVRDARGQSMASKDYEVSGSSRYDFKAARQKAVEALLDAMRAEGPVAGLGFGS